MRLSPTFAPVVAALALSACQAPTTIDPNFTQAELRAEQEAQLRAAKNAPLYFNDKKNYGYKQIDAMDRRFKPIAVRIQRASSQLCEAMQTGPAPTDEATCIFTATMNPHEHSLNAYADGQLATVNPAMVDFLKSDDQLAFVLAHEMAHNLMQHIKKQGSNANVGMAIGTLGDFATGMLTRTNSKGTYGKIGQQTAQTAYSPEFEAEADYVGLYILARAGYSIEKAPDVWRMMSQSQPDAIYVTTTHPNNPARTIAMTKTVAEIRAKQRAKQPLIPNIQKVS